jgi:hypothetical protein
MKWALIDGVRSLAVDSGVRGVCPGCGGEVQAVAVTSEFVVPHWRHTVADCDPWSEPESEWHRGWKARFPSEWQEVTMGPHRADVKGPDGVLEIQKSSISIEEVREREEFYGRMCWLLCGHDFWKNLEWLGSQDGRYSFRWKHARKVWLAAQKPLLIDTPWGLLRVKSINASHWTFVNGVFIQPSQLMKFLDRSESVEADKLWCDGDAPLAAWRGKMVRCAAQLEELRDWYRDAQRRTGWSTSDLCAQGLIPSALPKWMMFMGIREWLAIVPIQEAVDSVSRWSERRKAIDAFLAEEEIRQAGARQRHRDESDREEWERLERERRAQLALQEASFISRERFEQEQARQAEERRQTERAERARIRAAELLEQVAPLVLEWRRGDLIKEFLSYRGAPVGGFGRLETPFIESCLGSFEAAKARGKGFVESSAPPPPT